MTIFAKFMDRLISFSSIYNKLFLRLEIEYLICSQRSFSIVIYSSPRLLKYLVQSNQQIFV